MLFGRGSFGGDKAAKTVLLEALAPNEVGVLGLGWIEMFELKKVRRRTGSAGVALTMITLSPCRLVCRGLSREGRG